MTEDQKKKMEDLQKQVLELKEELSEEDLEGVSGGKLCACLGYGYGAANESQSKCECYASGNGHGEGGARCACLHSGGGM